MRHAGSSIARRSTESSGVIARIAPGLLEATHVDPVPVAPPDPAAGSPSVLPRPSSVRRPPSSRQRQVPRRGGLNIVGPFESTTAEGEVARLLARALAHHGGLVSTTSFHADGQPGPVPWAHRDSGDHPFDTTLLVLRPEDVANFVIENGAGAFKGAT